MAQCYCRESMFCEDCDRHVCGCVCEKDGAPQTQAEVTAGWVNPSPTRLEAWRQKQELTR
jgi:hypothetical protein